MLHLVITDTDTGETVVERDCVAVVAGYCTTDDDAMGVAQVRTTEKYQVGFAAAGAIYALQEVFNNEPDIKNVILDAFEEDGDEE